LERRFALAIIPVRHRAADADDGRAAAAIATPMNA
jgi:hypothetical protein